MAPVTVVADAPYKVYPGGVIALRCADWMGPARGTLTSAANADSVTGETVRDTQTCPGSIYSDQAAQYAAVDDTLVIDAADVPFEKPMTYHALISVLIEGDWDPAADTEQFRGSTQFSHRGACDMGMHGDFLDPLEANADFILHKPRLRPTFLYSYLDFVRIEDGTEVLVVRSYNHADSNTIIHLDQIVFLPFTSTSIGNWTSEDFERTGPNSGFSHPDTSDGSPPDGDDLGDDNGKFTRMPFATFNESGVTGLSDEGGGDYQQKADSDDAELMTYIVPDDGWLLQNSMTDTEVRAFVYSLHGVNFRGGQWWVEDDFDRTLGPQDWGMSADGFGYVMEESHTSETTTDWSVDGDVGVMALDVPTTNPSFETAQVAATLYGGDGSDMVFGTKTTHSCRIEASAENDIVFEGRFTMADVDSVWTDGPPGFGLGNHYMEASVTLRLGGSLMGSLPGPLYHLKFWRKLKVPGGGAWGTNDPADDYYLWTLVGPGYDDTAQTDGLFPDALAQGDISAWWGWGVETAFKIELRRYVIRVKVWEASGSEPGAWDYEDFRPMSSSLMTVADYPYTGRDLGDIYHAAWGNMTVQVVGTSTPRTGGFNVEWSLLRVGSDDEGGTPGSMFVRADRARDSESVGTFGELELPYGPQQLIYWGSLDITDHFDPDDPFPTNDSYIDLQSRVWNEVGVADLQRADSKFFYFRVPHGGVMSMNWSYGKNLDIRRVHA